MPNPIDNEELYNVIILGGVTSPGLVKKISGHDRKVTWDVKNGNGQKGASMSLKEIPLAEITIDIELADVDDFNAWPAFKDLIDSTVKTTPPKALDVYHPDLAENGITSVVKSLTAGTVHDGLGGQIKTIKLQEYAPPQPAGGSPNGSKAKSSTTDPDAAALAELQNLVDQYNNVPGGLLHPPRQGTP